MKIILKWQLNKENIPISACSIDPVHDNMIVGVGKTIIVINVENGEEIKRCEKHTGEITCLAYRKDGLWFASGG
jgi:WD40 repeat protein